MVIQKQNKLANTKFIIYFSFTLFLSVIVSLPFLAPILAHNGYKKLADVIYGIYSFMCHQKAHRSFFIYDEQCAWCARDTFIWSTILIVWLLVISGKVSKAITWKMAILLALPMALDGGIQFIATLISIKTQTTPFYESTNSIRAITGSFFGMAISLFFFPRLTQELKD